MCGRTLATQLVQTPPLASTFIIKGIGKLFLLVKMVARTTFMHRIAIKNQWSPVLSQRRETVKGQVMRQHAADRNG